MLRKIEQTHEFSHSLVCKYEGWLNSGSEFNSYYSNSENPPDFEDFELNRKLQFYSQLFKIRIKPEYEKDDTSLLLGTDFENILNSCVQKTEFEFTNNKNEIFTVKLNRDLEDLLAERKLNNPKRQVKISGILPNGLNFTGFADEVYENCIIDIKTTSNFSKSNYDTSLQIPLYLHFIPDYLVQRGFYQVTTFYRSKAVGKNEFTMKDTFMIESQHITESQLTKFSDMCAEILKNVSVFKKDVENYLMYFNHETN